MKFFGLALLASGAVAQVSVIRDAISAIDSATGKLTSAINAYNGQDQAPVLSAANAVSSAIKDGNSKVGGIAQLTDLSEALSLQDPTKQLASDVETSVNAAISKKDTFVKAGTAGIVLTQLQGFRTDAGAFSETVQKKVPNGAGSIAQGLVAPILASLDKGVKEFTGLPSGGSSSSAAGGASSSAAAPTGSSKPTSTAAGATTTKAGSTPTRSPPAFTGAAAPFAQAGFGGLAVAALVAAL